MDFFNDFLIIFEVAFFNVKIEARAKNIVNTVKKWRPGSVSSSKKCFVFDLVNILKFKMWKGEGGFVFGRLQKPKIVQKEYFLKKIIAQKRCKYRCFCFCGLLPWKMQSLNSSLFTVFYACVF